VPDGVDGDDLAAYCLMLADDALIASHRLQQWCTRAPELEEEVALANIALDLLGQARLLLTRAGQVDGSHRSEDDLAFWRDADAFRNVRFVEHPNGDFADQIAWLLTFVTWRLALLDQLRDSRDPVLAAVAAKGATEMAYHRDYAVQWVIRLGDGTAYSHERMQAALDAVVPQAGGLFAAHPIEARMAEAGIGADPEAAVAQCLRSVTFVAGAATLTMPQVPAATVCPGRSGDHTDAMAGLLDELQSLARTHEGATW
jgi:ring-1,2-phenylacetyl-CoA epoxidase subunit PaaC